MTQTSLPTPVPYALLLCRADGIDPEAVLDQQFLLTKQSAAQPAEFTVSQLGGWHLGTGPGLPVAVADLPQNGRVAFMGLAISPDGDLIDSAVLTALAKKAKSIDALLEYLNDSAGRFAVVVHTPDFTRLYLDGIGSLGAVYDPETHRAGATVNLVLTRAPDLNTAYPLTVDALNGVNRFAFGHTEDRCVKRLLSNHYLDLTNFSTHRHWPRPDTLAEPKAEDIPHHIGQIVRRFEQVIAAFVNQYDGPSYMPLSGGLDSRLLLACAKPVAEKLSFFCHAENRQGLKDIEIAERMTQACGVPMRSIKPRWDETYQINSLHRLAYLNRKTQIITGNRSTPSKDLQEVLHAHGKGGILLRGNVADFVKAVLWRRAISEYTQGTDHQIATGVRMMMLSDRTVLTNVAVLAAYEAWYEGLSGLARQRPFDLMFAEQFLSHGLGNLLYSFTEQFYVNPFNDRRLLALTTSLPPDKRFNLHYNAAIVNWRAPELANIPYLRGPVNKKIEELQNSDAIITPV